VISDHYSPMMMNNPCNDERTSIYCVRLIHLLVSNDDGWISGVITVY
jgi:hypothetical protein